ncbi:MAG: hypothetical protein CME36_11660 [unclassified Hahellaceae]|nr:hypothetical protein [Hahellaceae bacterium]
MISGFKKLVFATVFMPTLASADALNYKYVEGGLNMFYVEDEDLMGFQGRGAFSISENIFALAGVRSLSDTGDYSHVWLGAGYNQTLNQQTSAWAGVSVDNQETEWEEETRFYRVRYRSKETALGLRGGIRHQLNQQVELAGTARIVTGDLDHYAVSGTTRFAITPQFNLLGEIEIMEGDLGLLLGGSFFF